MSRALTRRSLFALPVVLPLVVSAAPPVAWWGVDFGSAQSVSALCVVGGVFRNGKLIARITDWTITPSKADPPSEA